MKILFFDNGNYSRSPAAEAIARSMIDARGLADRFAVSSAGLIDKHVGGPADPRTAAACARRGYDLSGFVCRRARSAIFAEFDEILAMDRQNLAALELARREGDRARLALFAGEDEVPDPFYGEADGFDLVVEMIEKRVREILGV
ncbi:MAG: low molecular weight protein-tyrosine-phosphatase [Parvularculaceae bacterium]